MTEQSVAIQLAKYGTYPMVDGFIDAKIAATATSYTTAKRRAVIDPL